MIRRVWEKLKGNRGPESKPDRTEELLRKSEEKMHEAEIEAREATELAASLHDLRAANQFRERMVLRIQGSVR